MSATYYLTVLPETSKLASGIRRAARAADNITVHPRVDRRNAERDGREYGNRFRRGFSSAAAGIGAGLRGVTVGFKLAAAGAGSLVRHVGTVATVVGVASRLTKGFALSLLAGASALKLVAGVSLVKLAGALALVSRLAGRLATQISRVTSAILVLAAVGKLLGFMQRAAKWMSLLTVGSVALLGVAAGLANMLGTVLVSALLTVGAAMGVAAGAAVGILAPALLSLKMGFQGLSDGAKEFNKQFGEADEAFNKMVGERMGPLLTAFRELRLAVVDTFSATLQPAFATLGGVIDGLRPRFAQLTGTLGAIGNHLADTLASPAVSAALDSMFAASDRFFQHFLGTGGLGGLVEGLAKFASTAATTFADVGVDIGGALQRFGDWLANISPEQMVATFAALRQVIENVGNVIGPIWNFLRDLGAMSAPALAPGFAAIGDAIGQAAPGVMRMAEVLMPALSQVMQNLAPVLPALVAAFHPWAQTLAVLAPVLATVVAELAPLAPLLLATTLAVKAIAIGMALYNTAMLLAANATKIVRTAIWLLNAAFIASPIGLIVTAVVGLGAALWAFFTKTETGRKLWEKIWPAIVNAAKVAWEWIKNTLGKAWEAIQPGLQKIGDVAREAFSSIGNAIQQLWPKVQPAIEWLGRLWLTVAKWQFGNAIGALKMLGGVIGWLWTNVVVPAFNGIASTIATAWNAAKVVWDAMTTAVQWVGDKIMWLWNAVAVPAFTAIRVAAEAFWNGVKIVWDTFTGAIETVGGKVTAFKDGLVTAFNAVRDVVVGVWDKIGGIIDKIGNGVGKVADVLRDVPVLGNLIPGARDGGQIRGYADGGQISGPGTGRSDSILGFPAMVRVANGEFVTNARTTAEYLPLLQALNAGVPLPEILAALLPRFAEGGMVGADELARFASGVEGAPYEWGGVNWGDCSGAVSAVANYAVGMDPFGSRFSTATAASELSSRGFESGVGPEGSLRVGWYNGGPQGGHMAATLPDGTNFEMGGARGNGQFGGSAAGADDPQFTDHAYLPPEWFTGLDGGSPTIGGSYGSSSAGVGGGGGSSVGGSTGGGSYRAATDKELTSSASKVDSAATSAKNADQSVDDAEYRLKRANDRLAEARAEGKDTEDAQRAVDVANRELADAKERQRKAHDKLTDAENADAELRSKGKLDTSSGGSSGGGGMGGDDLGRTFVSGMLETIGLDGSVFANPLEWPLVKSLMAGVNYGGGLLAGLGADQSGGGLPGGGFVSGAADAVGLGGMLAPIEEFQSGSPRLAAGEVNPAVAGSGGSMAQGALNALSAFAPAPGQQGAQGGPVDNSINIVNPVGNVPPQWREQVHAEQNARTRTTQVR